MPSSIPKGQWVGLTRQTLVLPDGGYGEHSAHLHDEMPWVSCWLAIKRWSTVARGRLHGELTPTWTVQKRAQADALPATLGLLAPRALYRATGIGLASFTVEHVEHRTSR